MPNDARVCYYTNSMNRADAYDLLCEYVTDLGLRRHCLCVEVAMRAYARKLGQDELAWGVAGLLHDFDYERWPNPPDHPLQGSEILRARGYPEEVITCILSHADYLADRYPRRTRMEKGLYACDEVTGLITATALLRPMGINDLTASSVRKKMKSKGFARGVNRDDVVRGAADFGVDLDAHIQFVIDAMKGIAAELGLDRGSAGDGPAEESA
ncbi:MAG TPA: HDIG domain-containing protein [Gemmataceae bacterium]|nr:HDIG domain-containing protein [Gemmataceae bacterium]